VQVLRESVRVLRSGGRIFLGDLRNLRLLRLFHTSVQLAKAPDTITVGQLRNRVERALAQEKELAVDPRLFEVLPAVIPEIGSVDVNLKRGSDDNELTLFRYDAVLQCDRQRSAIRSQLSFAWGESITSLQVLEELLQQSRPAAVRISAIPNARLSRHAVALRLIAES